MRIRKLNKSIKIIVVLLLLITKSSNAQIDIDFFESPDSTLSKVISAEIIKTKNNKKCVLVIVNRGRGINGSESAKRDSLIKCHIATNNLLYKEGVLIYSSLLEDDKVKHKFMYILYSETVDQAKKYFKSQCYPERSEFDSEEWWGPTTLNGIRQIAFTIIKK